MKTIKQSITVHCEFNMRFSNQLLLICISLLISCTQLEDEENSNAGIINQRNSSVKPNRNKPAVNPAPKPQDTNQYCSNTVDFVCNVGCSSDPDCNDVCVLQQLYGNGRCDDRCSQLDPDCQEVNDFCATNGWYYDYSCDECPFTDPDCSDICVINDWYHDGDCDEICGLPDPDCQVMRDTCDENGLYNDGICHDFCPYFDPDCQQMMEATSCVMAAHDGISSYSLFGFCTSQNDCNLGIKYIGSDCAEVCCIPEEDIDQLQSNTLSDNFNDCVSQYNGFCVETGLCDNYILDHLEGAGICSNGNAFVACCQPN
jgi:hypothetical protein